MYQAMKFGFTLLKNSVLTGKKILAMCPTVQLFNHIKNLLVLNELQFFGHTISKCKVCTPLLLHWTTVGSETLESGDLTALLAYFAP